MFCIRFPIIFDEKHTFTSEKKFQVYRWKWSDLVNFSVTLSHCMLCIGHNHCGDRAEWKQSIWMLSIDNATIFYCWKFHDCTWLHRQWLCSGHVNFGSNSRVYWPHARYRCHVSLTISLKFFGHTSSLSFKLWSSEFVDREPKVVFPSKRMPLPNFSSCGWLHASNNLSMAMHPL